MRSFLRPCLIAFFAVGFSAVAQAATSTVVVPVNRSALVVSPTEMGEVIVANPEVADVHAHGVNNLSVIGKKMGHTTLRIFDRKNQLIRTIDVNVTYDLPGIRRALKNFLPNETINVESVNTNIALTGHVSNATAAENAMRIAKQFIDDNGAAAAGGQAAAGAAPGAQDFSGILNMLQITSGQQVMLRVRVGEIQRDTLKTLGIDLSVASMSGAGALIFSTGSGIPGYVAGSGVSPGQFTLPTGDPSRGIGVGLWQPDGPSGDNVGGFIKALERDGLFKLLAEPNLVAVSGEQAEFLAGGELPIPIAQASSGSTPTISIEYKPFGVAVKFTPYVLTENRIRLQVQPEVSELSSANSVRITGFLIPSITTRRTKTTVELAPGESFMIAGLIKDQTRSGIDQLPGVKDLPVLGALFRSTEFQRNETELVIAVTPYIVDPAKSSDIKLPTDGFKEPTLMEKFFYGALTSMGGQNGDASNPTPEGPVGFMVE